MSDIIEAAARGICEARQFLRDWDGTPEDDREWYRSLAQGALAAVTPLIRAAALEDAAKVAEDCEMNSNEEVDAQLQIIAAIRALKEQP